MVDEAVVELTTRSFWDAPWGLTLAGVLLVLFSVPFSGWMKDRSTVERLIAVVVSALSLVLMFAVAVPLITANEDPPRWQHEQVAALADQLGVRLISGGYLLDGTDPFPPQPVLVDGPGQPRRCLLSRFMLNDRTGTWEASRPDCSHCPSLVMRLELDCSRARSS